MLTFAPLAAGNALDEVDESYQMYHRSHSWLIASTMMFMTMIIMIVMTSIMIIITNHDHSDGYEDHFHPS